MLIEAAAELFLYSDFIKNPRTFSNKKMELSDSKVN